MNPPLEIKLPTNSRIYRNVLIGLIIACLQPAFAIAAVTFEWAAIGNPANPSDSTGKGTVDEVFNIAKHEVTNGQYVEFLNAVDPEGTNERVLYDSKMNRGDGGIRFDPEASSGAKFSLLAGREQMPVNYVNWPAAARFANWMHNGQGSGSTESGAYDMALEMPRRTSGARFFVPSENEWYKAAYHDPRSPAEGGPPGDDHYWFYPTRSESSPRPEAPPGGINSANYDNGEHLSWGDTTTQVGAYTDTTSFYGGFDMAGNVWEWILDEDAGLRGGSWANFPFDNLHLRSTTGPAVSVSFIVDNDQGVGFRLGSIPKPVIRGDMNGDQLVNAFDIEPFVQGLVDAAGYTEATGMNPVAFGDINGDGKLDSFDIDPFVVLLTGGTAEVFGTGENRFAMNFVGIGDPGNADDTIGVGHGAVPYAYRMGTYEVSEDMVNKANAAGSLGIAQTDLGANKPSSSISWNEAARFVNWLNASRGFQAPYAFSTQPGDLGYDPNENITLWGSGEAWQLGGENLFRHKDARYFLPSEDEWYKAAYYGGAGTYFEFATGTGDPPIPVANGTTPGTAVYQTDHLLIRGPADIMNAGGLSPNGTMAQNGNAHEWLESAFVAPNDSPAKQRVYRGGSWLEEGLQPLQSLARGISQPTIDSGGFRVAAVGEPVNGGGTLAQLLALRQVALLPLEEFRISSVHRAASGIEIVWISQVDSHYLVEHSPSAQADSWNPVTEISLRASSETTTFVDSDKNRLSRGESFYRVRLVSE